MVSHCGGSSTAEPFRTCNTRCSTWAVLMCWGATKHPRGDTPAPAPADLDVTAETLQCRPGPPLLLLAQPDFQKALADPPRSAPPVQKGIHMLCPQQASLKEYHRPGLTTEIPQKSVLNFAILLGEETPRTVLKTQKMSFKT